jgi:hypothetical protein
MRCAGLLLLVVVFGAARVSAEGRGDLLGKRIRVQTTGATQVVGLVVDSDADSLSIQSDPDGSVSRVARGEVRRLEVSRGFRRHTIQGLVGGVVAWGAVVGLYAAFDTLDESGVGEPLFIGGVVAAGGLVGSLIKTERWEPVPGAVVSLRVLPRRRGVQAEVVLAF